MLDDGIRSARSGARSILLITGEAGIGKTSLLDALAARLEAASGRAVWGRTWEVGLTPAFWPWTQVLGALAEPDDPAPELVGLDDRSDAASRLARFDAVGTFLSRRSAERPLGILLDDMHAADRSSMLLLEYLARHVRNARFLIAITARDGEASDETEQALARIRRDAKRVAVGRLDEAAVAELVNAEPAVVQQVHRLSGGNPLFVEELVACIAAHGDLSGIAQVSGVRAVIRERVARLPANTVHALGVAALLGRELRGAVLADVLEVAPAELAQRLAPAIRIGVLTAASSDRFRFSHALVAESLADEAAVDTVHARAAAALERLEGDDGAAAIAHHRLAAYRLDPDAAVVAAERAARVALAQLAFEDAAALLDRAISVLVGDDADTRKRRASLLCTRAEALQHAGDHDQARAVCNRAAELARSIGDGVLLARVALAHGIEFRFGATDRVLVERLREALAAMPPGDSSLRARCLARLAAAEQPASDPRLPIADAFEAIAMARRVGDRRTRLDVIHVAFAAMIDYVPARTLDELLRETFELATSPGDRLIALRDRLRHCFVTLDLGERPAFDAAVAAHAELADSIGIGRWLWPVKLVAAMTALFEGRFDDAATATEEAQAIANAANDPQCSRTLLFHRWIAALTRTGQLATHARAVGELFPHTRAAADLMIRFEERTSDLAAWLPATDELAAGDESVAACIADMIVACNDRARAHSLYARLTSSIGRVYVASMTGFAISDFADRVLLVLADCLGEHDRIDDHAGRALEIAQRLGARPWLARIRADWATALDHRSRPGDRPRADELWQIAHREAERMAMPGLLERCRAARPDIRSLDTAPARRAAPVTDAVSLAREGELWVVRGLGCDARVRDSRGMQMLVRLVAEPGRELHALELVGDGGGVDTGDSGEALDPKAKAAYRRRLADLTEELEEAEAWADPVRCERARAEIEALTAELKRAVGLSNRDRKIGAASERARSNVQRRLSYAIQQIRAVAPALADHFCGALRTGTFCVYEPTSSSARETI